MATDATGTPTSLGIRKYNTSVDAPSGLGFNGAMDDIDALLVARVTKPTGVLTNDVPVWNGTTWVKPTGSHTGTNFLRDDGSWSPATSVTYRSAGNPLSDIVSTAALTTFITQAIAAGMGANGVLRITAQGDYLNNSGANQGFELKSTFGGVTLFDVTWASQTTNRTQRMPWRMVMEIRNLNATNSQQADAFFVVGSNTSTITTGIAGLGDPAAIAHVATSGAVAVDTTASQTLVVQYAHSASNALLSMRTFGWLIEVI